METKETHIATMRKRYASNAQRIRAAFNWSEEEYANQWLDTGLAYLEMQYPVLDAKYADYHTMIRDDRAFWAWWLVEWKRKEDYFFRIFHQNLHDATPEDYQKVMTCLLSDGRVDTSFFEQYILKLKTIKNAKNKTSID